MVAILGVALSDANDQSFVAVIVHIESDNSGMPTVGRPENVSCVCGPREVIGPQLRPGIE